MKILICSVFLINILIFSPFVYAEPAGLTASRAENIEGARANSNGVYPVRLHWSELAGSDHTGINTAAYHVYRSAIPDTGFEKISREPVVNAGGFFTFIDENPLAIPGKQYYYRVISADSEDEIFVYSEPVMGYGALSHDCYFHEFNKTVKTAHQKATLMNKPGTFNKLGSETNPGNISGTFSYRARISGLGGRVLTVYDNYADHFIDNNRNLGPCFILNGNCNTSASISQNGKMDGTVRVTGMYPGWIYYDNVEIKSGKVGGGTHGVEPEGFPRVEIHWTVD